MCYMLNWFKTSLIKRTLLSLKNYAHTLWMMRQTSFMAPDLFLSRASHCSVEFEIRNISNFLRGTRSRTMQNLMISIYCFAVGGCEVYKSWKCTSWAKALLIKYFVSRRPPCLRPRVFLFFFCPLSKDLMNKTIAQHVRFKTVYIS